LTSQSGRRVSNPAFPDEDGSGFMRVLMVSKACLVGAYQAKLEAMAASEQLDLTVIVPPVWREPSGPVSLERSHTNGYRLLVDPIRFNGHFHLHYYPRLRRRLEEIRPHILHLDEEPYNLATWLGVRQARAVGAKTLFFSWQNLLRRYPFPFRQMEKQVLRLVDYAIMGNQASVDVWRAKGYRGPYKVIPQFGVRPDIFHPPERRDAGRAFVIGSAGRRLVPEKGIDLLLQAAAELPGVWLLHIAGEGPERPRLEALARRLRISERVLWDGAIPSLEVPAYLRQMDVLVLPSLTRPNWKEQFGRVLVEAMACGAVVVGSDSGEIPNVIGDAGLHFPEGDAAALRERLLRLMTDDDLLNDLRQRGRERVLAHYTQERVAARTVDVYRKMLAAPRAVHETAI
jgi:glycosyltransferase involved in cell wall biosynthesis